MFESLAVRFPDIASYGPWESGHPVSCAFLEGKIGKRGLAVHFSVSFGVRLDIFATGTGGLLQFFEQLVLEMFVPEAFQECFLEVFPCRVGTFECFGVYVVP